MLIGTGVGGAQNGNFSVGQAKVLGAATFDEGQRLERLGRGAQKSGQLGIADAGQELTVRGNYGQSAKMDRLDHRSAGTFNQGLNMIWMHRFSLSKKLYHRQENISSKMLQG
jgi:hypothetical protein